MNPRSNAGIALVLALGLLDGCGGGTSSAGPQPGSSPTPTGSGFWVTGYYPAYAIDTMPIAAIPWSSLTHLIHFALAPGTDGTLGDPTGLEGQTQTLVAAAHQAGVKILLGVGGDTSVKAPAGFRASTTDALRGILVANMVDAMAAGGYDGLDVNWESLEFPADVSAFQAFIRDLRAALDQHA